MMPVRRPQGWTVGYIEAAEKAFEEVPVHLRSSVVAVLWFKNGKTRFAGTAFFISPSLLVTARHVVWDDEIEQPVLPPGVATHTFEFPQDGHLLLLVRGGDADDAPAVIEVLRTSLSGHNSDVGLLEIDPSEVRQYFPDLVLPVACPLTRTAPEVGGQCLAVGYADPTIDGTSDWVPAEPGQSFAANVPLRARAGVIRELHPSGRGTSNTGLGSFPVFEVSAHYDHMMSGGPVFNEQGEVIGVVSSSFDFEGDEEPVAAASYIAPLLALPVNDPTKPGTTTTLVELLERGVIPSAGSGTMTLLIDYTEQRYSVEFPNNQP